MVIDYNELLNALRIIKKTCESNPECNTCPLRDNFYVCVVSDSMAPEPAKWKIKSDIPAYNWRAFEEEA